MALPRQELQDAISSHLLGKRANTVISYKRYYRMFADYFSPEGSEPRPINVPNLKLFQHEIISQLTNSVQQPAIYSIKSLLSYLFVAELVAKDYSKIITKSAVRYVRKEDRSGMTLGDVDDLIATARELDPTMVVYLQLAIRTGARLDELRNLQVENFRGTPDKMNVHFRNTKGGQDRKINIKTTPEIQAALAVPGAVWIFPSPRKEGFPLSKTGIDKKLRRIVQATEDMGKQFSSHFIRHLFANEMKDKYGLLTASKLLGHSSITTSERYFHSNLDDIVVDYDGAPAAPVQEEKYDDDYYVDSDVEPKSEEELRVKREERKQRKQQKQQVKREVKQEGQRARKRAKQEHVRREGVEVVDLVKSSRNKRGAKRPSSKHDYIVDLTMDD